MADLTTNMVACYELNGDLTDSYGSKDFTNTGSVTFTSGLLSQCGSFNGSSQRALYTGGVDSSAQGAISLWIKITAGSTADMTAFSYGGSASSAGAFYIYFDYSGGKYAVTLYQKNVSATAWNIRTDYLIDPDAWYHVLIQSDSSTWTIYINGVSQTLYTSYGNNGDWWSDSGSGAGYYTVIGALRARTSYDTYSSYFNGLIDQISVFSQPLTAPEIVAIYNSGSGAAYPIVYYVPGPLQAIISTISEGIDGVLIGPSSIASEDGEKAILAGIGINELGNINWSLGKNTDQLIPVGIGRNLQFLLKNQVGPSADGAHAIRIQFLLGDLAKSIQAISSSLVSDTRGMKAITGVLSAGDQNMQAIRMALLQGDVLKSIQAVVNKLASSAKGAHALKNVICYGESHIHSLLNVLGLGDSIKSTTAIINNLANNVSGSHVIKAVISDGIKQIQAILLSMLVGDKLTGTHAAINKLASDSASIQGLINTISTSAQSIEAIKNVVSAGDVQAMQAILLQLHPTDLVQSIQAILNEVNTTAAVHPSNTVAVYLDGRPILRKIVPPVEITYDEGSVHNSISFKSADMTLFHSANPVTLRGQSRIEVHVDSEVMYFLLEQRDGDEKGFSVWGRSISARDDSPYSEATEFTLAGPEAASSIAARLPVYAAVDWDAVDWIVPTDFQYSGNPIDGIQNLASAIGAIVRSEDDGSLKIRAKYPTRPIDMASATADVDYGRSGMLRMGYNFTEKSGYNAIVVTGRTSGNYTPDTEVEESSPEKGSAVHVRVYWAGRIPSVIGTYVTDGIMTDLGFYTVALEETVEFKDGIGSVAKPIDSVTSTTWIGATGTAPTYTKYEKDLIIGVGEFRIATVKYTTTFQRFRLTRHNVDMLMAVLMYADGPDVYILVRTAASDTVLASPISNSLLSTDEAAVEAGTAWLDDNMYDKQVVTIRTPYHKDAIDGNLAFINNPAVDHAGVYKIVSSKIIIESAVKVINELGVERCLV